MAPVGGTVGVPVPGCAGSPPFWTLPLLPADGGITAFVSGRVTVAWLYVCIQRRTVDT
jgi:hypothetical protein